MSKELCFKVRGKVSFNQRDASVDATGERIVVTLDTPKRMGLTCTSLARLGKAGIADITKDINRRHALKYVEGDIRHVVRRLVKLGLLIQEGEGFDTVYKLTRNAIPRLKKATKLVV